MTNSLYWLIASAAFFALEAFGVPGVGFLFVALGAAFTAILVEASLLAADDLVSQGAVFLLASSLSGVLLWRKLKQWRMNPNAPHYSNIVGTGAKVTKPFAGTAEGEVTWSGTRMRAKLANPDDEPLTDNALVTITRVDGTLLFVTAK